MKPFLSIRGPSLAIPTIKTNAVRTQSRFSPKTAYWSTSGFQTHHNQICFVKNFATEKESTSTKKSTPKKPKAPPKENSDAPFYELKKGEPVPSKPDQVKPVYTKKPVDVPTEPKSPPPQPAKSAKKTRIVLNDKGEVVIPLGSDFLRVTVRSYNGMVLVDVRKFFKDSNSGEMRPGSKGISLSIDQWNELKRQIEYIDQAIPMIPVTPKTKPTEPQSESEQ